MAVVVGIDKYARGPLRGCVNDANDVAEILAMPEYAFDVKLITDSQATRRGILNVLRPLAETEGDTLLVYFAGHGVVESGGGYLVTVDEADWDPGISLGELGNLLTSASDRFAHVVAILDSCHSGSAPSWMDRAILSDSQLATEISASNASRVLLAACRPEQYAWESDSTSPRGAFTQVLADGLMSGAVDFDGNVTMHSLFDYVSSAIDRDDQIPVFKGDAAGSVILGSGFRPREGRPMGTADINREVAKAQQLINDYQSLQTLELSQMSRRSARGLKTCAAELTEALRWFEDTTKGLPELKRENTWQDQEETLRNYRATLSQIGRNDQLPVGRVESLIGAGGFGRVWKIETQDGPLAYKVFHGGELAERIKVMRFRTGYHSMRKLKHPRIVEVFELTEAPLGFTMGFVNGSDLRSAPVDRRDVGEILSVISEISDVVRFAHAAKVIHRDIKPENVVMGWDENLMRFVPYLTDFDLAYIETQRTVTINLVGGVINYAAPEQFYASKSEAARAATVDVYALAQLLYYLVCGRDPRADRVDENLTSLKTALGEVADRGVAEPLLELYEAATQVNPALRPQTVEEMCSALLRARTAHQEALLGLARDPMEVCRQVAYAYGGPASYGENGEAVHFMSRSRTTSVAIAQRGVEKDGISDFAIRLAVSEKFGVQGASSGAEARQVINQRISKRLARYDGTQRIPGNQGFFETKIVVSDVKCDRTGVERLAEVLSAVLSGIEDW